MNENDFKNIGKQIEKGVQEALHSKEFVQFKETIKSTVKDMVGPQQPGNIQQAPPVQPPIVSAPGVTPSKAPGSVSGILLLVFGFLGIGVLSACLLAFSIVALVSELKMAGIVLGVLAPLLLACIVMVICGFHLRGRVNRFRQYREKLRGCSFCPIDVLASAIGQTNRYVAKDLKKMIRLGMFPDGHIDDEETCLMLDYETYRQYLKAKEDARRQQTEENKPAEAAENSAGTMIAEGREALRQIRQANDAIPGEEISRKLTRLEEVATRIFAYVEQHPEKLPDIRKFMQYYLPTTLKLVRAYREFDAQPVEGGNIAAAKKDIRDALDTINNAFENLLRSLFQNDVLDVSTDITVLETMLAQEGLTDGDFTKK